MNIKNPLLNILAIALFAATSFAATDIVPRPGGGIIGEPTNQWTAVYATNFYGSGANLTSLPTAITQTNWPAAAITNQIQPDQIAGTLTNDIAGTASSAAEATYPRDSANAPALYAGIDSDGNFTHTADGAGLTNIPAAGVVGLPTTNGFVAASVTNGLQGALGYTPLTNTALAITNALATTPVPLATSAAALSSTVWGGISNAATGGNKMTILANGNVGVGTANPAYRISISTGASGSVGLQLSSGTEVADGAASSAIKFTDLDNSHWETATYQAYQHIFEAAGTEKVRILANGNVGIGYATPTFPLEIRNAGGGGRLGLSVNNVMSDFGRDSLYYAMGDNSTDQAGHAWLIRNGSVANNFAFGVDFFGRFGIGTSRPSTKLDVAGTVTATGLNITNAIGTYGTPPSQATAYNPALMVALNGTNNVMTITNGNVGIGTANPATRLDVNGTVTASNLIYSSTNLYDDLMYFVNDLNPPGGLTGPTIVGTSGRDSESLSAVFNTDDTAILTAQMPHTWVAGSTIFPHWHIEPQTTAAVTNVWRVKYSVADIGGQFPAWTVTTNTTIIPASNQWAHWLVSVPANGIPMTGKTGPSTAVKIRLEMISSNVDTHVIAADVHYRVGGSPAAYNP